MWKFRYQEEYAKRFSDFKPDRKIRFISNLGTVTLELELSDRTLSVEVTPLQAAMIDLFSERGKLSRAIFCCFEKEQEARFLISVLRLVPALI